ncbi:RAMP superfamily CRISPR-associated protein [uncultured Fusobacterium sp.]|uniref:RAMP superfamily CRISPR-associated protein n=1 Tax=uncultured Fusobacterium sp. TaxID=159267 RepID=UPI0025E6011C|nr:RAMP superfamily CRISPR-associated protein [uncultured Fusobacterium sp.]
MKINYTVKLKTPALTASLGIIGKDIDVVVKVDSKGKPFFNGKHIKGILKERVTQFKLGLGESEEETKKFIDKYFGKEGNYIKDNNFDKIRFSNLVLVDKNNYNIDDRYGIKIDRKTRTTVHNSLFRYEHITAGTEFKGEIEVPDKIDREDLKFILACLFHLDTIGGFKSRGIGKVDVFIKERELKYKENEDIIDNIIFEILKSNKENSKANLNGKLKKYSYTLSLKEPFILTGREIGNYVEVRDSIQGSTVRGAMIEYFAKSKDVSLEDLLCIEASDATSGDISLASKFITKYPINKKNKKEAEKVEIDRVIDSRTEIKDEVKEKGVKLERKGTSMLKAKGNEISIAINSQTKSVEDGMLFNSEYLQCDEKLIGDIVLPEGLVDENKDYTIYLGKMKSKGFGEAVIKFGKYEKERVNLKARIEKLQKQANEKILTFDLQSDLVLPFNTIYNVGEQFKSLIGISEMKFIENKSYINTGKLGGYNIINNIRKVDELVITRGSVLTYEIDDFNSILPKLEEIEEKGLGLRKNEGFGKVKISSERGEK